MGFDEHYHNYNNGQFVCDFCHGIEYTHKQFEQKYEDNYRFLKFMKGEKCDNS